MIILSASLNLPLQCLADLNDRQVYVATGYQADTSAIKSIEQTGAKILYAGEAKQVEGQLLIDALAEEGFRNIYSIAGPGVLQTLLHARVLNLENFILYLLDSFQGVALTVSERFS